MKKNGLLFLSIVILALSYIYIYIYVFGRVTENIEESVPSYKIAFSQNTNESIAKPTAIKYIASTEKLDYSYKGQLNSEKRFLAIGFDDFRESDFAWVIPLFEKYGFRATFNKIIWTESLSEEEKAEIDNVVMGGHELGDHTIQHRVNLFMDPLCNGQDPREPEGGQVPYPSNEQLRADRGDGKNVFGIPLTNTTGSLYMFSDFDVPFGELTDEQCQFIREFYSLIKDPKGLCVLLDELSNRYIGTSGNSLGSWDDAKQCYTGGIFSGCKTSANHEVWERVLLITQMFYKDQYGLNYNIKTWSMPGDIYSPFLFESGGHYYYDEKYTVHANFLAKMPSSLSNQNRSWTDVLRAFGYNISHDYWYPGRGDGQTVPMMSKQFIYNASLSRKDAVTYPTNWSIPFMNAGAEYTEGFFTEGKSRATQMYDSGGEYYKFIESIRNNTSNGMIHGEVIDSIDSISERIFMEELLRYCKETGVEVITKSEAYDICFNHKLYCGNLIYNPHLRNTAKEFMPDSELAPSNPDGYSSGCYVTHDENNVPILNIVDGQTVEYLHYGVPLGELSFSVDATGENNIEIYAIQNKDSLELEVNELTKLAELPINNHDDNFENYSTNFFINDCPVTEYEQRCEGYGEKIMGLKIVYGSGLSIKNIKLTLN